MRVFPERRRPFFASWRVRSSAALVAASLLACGGPEFTTAASAGDDSGTGPHGDAGAPRFCTQDAGTHTFCDDFDGPALGSAWTDIQQTGGGAAITDSSLFFSAPHSLSAVVPASPATSSDRAQVVKSFGTQVSHIVTNLELYIDAVGPKTALGADALFFVGLGANGGYMLGLDANADNVGFFEEAIGDGGALAAPLSAKTLVPTSGLLKTWTSVTFDVDLAKSTVSISLNGTLELSNAPITPPAGSPPVLLYVGLQSRNISSPMGAHYDNVTVDVTP
ncbi:MAG TPA: hypothetical protein VGI39_08920 [Polyangiaceae bacterium]|jgi:hypothetical protein